ncbi:ferredoxin reductase [Natronosporangium hydrolyticum]|uniref:Ferredoxin reductase n=1 Tax=Natronosporangium hydrolyticum TaxID=2811111 RepID=A0A895YG79_9ACTN|nr:ferredoxin reductase [Natronosporangium hydrolyticum]QSB16571.1 ferredoxin reductase [Natronosporangium hydrolyticum]
MARTAVPGRLTGQRLTGRRPTGRRLPWRVARLASYRDETATARTLTLAVPGWPGHVAGQHVDLRLTAADGYQAQRSYSVAGAPTADQVELTIERVPGGEVSPYLTDQFRVGDPLEIRGPVGGWFVWRPQEVAPVLLVAGGSGIVPLMSMIRHRHAAGNSARFRLVYSTRSPAAAYYTGELAGFAAEWGGISLSYVYTRAAPAGSERPVGRLTPADLAAADWSPVTGPRCFVCGPTGFVEAAADALVQLGHAPEQIRTERFGPTGG